MSLVRALVSTAHVASVEPVVLLVDHQLKSAIAQKRLIQFTYSSVSRLAEPHDYGIQHDVVRLLVYQLHSTPFSKGWRLLDVAKMEHLVVLPQTFDGSRGAAHRHHNEWDRVFARVE